MSEQKSILCSLCFKAVNSKQCKLDELGRPVHEECYEKSLLYMPPKKTVQRVGFLRNLGTSPGVKAMKARAVFWTVAMAYTGFLLTGQGLRTFNSLSITEALLGALTGFLLAIMFTLREGRRKRPAFVTYSVEQMFPNWPTSSENRGSDLKPKR
jgi:hypothetical protein